MITLRRAGERRLQRRRKLESWHTFHSEGRADALARGFGALVTLDEHRLPPGARIPRAPRHQTEIVTYVREGALVHESATGVSGIIHAGEFHRMTREDGGRHREANASWSTRAHVFQLGLSPLAAGLDSAAAQRRFSTAERRRGLCLVASLDGRNGSLRTLHDARVYSAILPPGQHMIHELSAGRGAWLHLVHGEVTLDGLVLTVGDGAGVTSARAVSLTAWRESEILLIDLPV